MDLVRFIVLAALCRFRGMSSILLFLGSLSKMILRGLRQRKNSLLVLLPSASFASGFNCTVQVKGRDLVWTTQVFPTWCTLENLREQGDQGPLGCKTSSVFLRVRRPFPLLLIPQWPIARRRISPQFLPRLY
ncbi:uncharacterized protein EI90DRAFT_3083244 [Cantharellus anzutake]|uniref:uncharacterized protein n=1 Tax=Cantharellus anzutake TaxID=1750568 RepID=UPI001902FBC9|nr:uncharacterized protein EI90DRAFT_3083244 [Cantharellus anzutake]KAF8318619.1 hypothetical protein EI90DRAFT_3083244 [Cantharellus anzutake]